MPQRTESIEFAAGYTLYELLMVLAIVSVLLAIAVPNFKSVFRSIESRKAARDVVSLLRAARVRALATNFEHKVEFDSDNNRYRLVQGDRQSNSHRWDTVVQDWTALEGARISMDANINSIHFNPDGSSNHGSITLSDTTTELVFKVVVSRTGRARIDPGKRG